MKAAYAGGMVNARMVNAAPSYFPPPHFCESFPAFAPIPRFRNPFKYTGRLRINLPGGPKGEDPAIFCQILQWLMATPPHLALP